jgi:hypothetical protein
VNSCDRGVKDILEACQLRHRLLSRGAHDFVRASLREDAPSVQDQHSLSEGKYFFPAVRYIKNRNSMLAIPLTQITHNSCLGCYIQCSQRFVE